MRNKKILTAIDPSRSKGLEIGPLDKPIVTRDMGDIRYVDHCSREELLEKYAQESVVNLDKIPEVDYVWGAKTLKEIIGPDEKFDYLIASHVIEHVPDLLGWLEEINQILADNGVLSLVIPDKRVTFDMLRKESSAAEMLHAYLTKSRKPTVEQLFDCISHFREVDLKGVWSKKVKADNLPPGKLSLKEIYDICVYSLEPDAYVDNHCWVFTPYSFFELFKVAVELKIINYKVLHFYTTEKNQVEFFVTLQKLPDNMSPEDKYKEQIKSIPKVTDKSIEQIGFEKKFFSTNNHVKYLLYVLKNKVYGKSR